MQLKRQIDTLLRPLIGQKAWGASVGWGSFVTIEFGPKRLYQRHFHGDWHLWLYQCEWELNSSGSESKKKVMQLAVENLNGAELKSFSFDSQRMSTKFSFDNDLHLSYKPYPDAVPDEQCWILFTPNRQATSLRESGLRYEAMDVIPEASLAQR